jgi:hypothetical protein
MNVAEFTREAVTAAFKAQWLKKVGLGDPGRSY